MLMSPTFWKDYRRAPSLVILSLLNVQRTNGNCATDCANIVCWARVSYLLSLDLQLSKERIEVITWSLILWVHSLLRHFKGRHMPSLILIGTLDSLGHIFSSTNQMPLLVSNILWKSSFLLLKSNFIITTLTMLVSLVVVKQWITLSVPYMLHTVLVKHIHLNVMLLQSGNSAR